MKRFWWDQAEEGTFDVAIRMFCVLLAAAAVGTLVAEMRGCG